MYTILIILTAISLVLISSVIQLISYIIYQRKVIKVDEAMRKEQMDAFIKMADEFWSLDADSVEALHDEYSNWTQFLRHVEETIGKKKGRNNGMYKP